MEYDVAEDLKEIMYRLPMAFRVTPPGKHVQVIPIMKDGRIDNFRMQLSVCRSQSTLTLTCKKYGGPARTKALAEAIAKRCGFKRVADLNGPEPGKPNAKNKTGAGNIQFNWRIRRQINATLHVTVVEGIAGKGKGMKSFSVNKHGLEGALDKAIAIRRQGGFEVDREMVLAKLREEFHTKRRAPVTNAEEPKSLKPD